MNSNPAPSPTVKAESAAGPTIGTIIVLLVIILGGVYFWTQRDNSPATDKSIEESLDASADLEAMRTQDSSDETSSIDADIESTDVDSIDADLETI